jgi:hypothetical protein
VSRPIKKSPKNKNKKTKNRRSDSGPSKQTNDSTDAALDPAIGRFDGNPSDIPIGPGSVASSILYLQAHQLIPGDYRFDPIRDSDRVETAAATLDKPDVTTAEFLRAIVILGHSPCAKALETLEKWANTRHPYASVARVALRECKSLKETID